MTVSKQTLVVGAGLVLGVAAVIMIVLGAATTAVSTYVLAGAVVLTLAGIVMNTQRNASPDRTMGRLLHDPETRSAMDARGVRSPTDV